MGTLNGELKQAVLNNRRAQAIVVTKAGRKVIVVGCMASNLPPNLRDHPMIDYWYGDSGLAHRHVPETAGMMLHTRFVHHKDIVRLKEEAHRKGVEFYPQPFTTGDLREILEPLAIVPPKLADPMRLVDHNVVLAAVPQAFVAQALGAPPVIKEQAMGAGNGSVAPATPRGALKAFVTQHAQFTDVPSDVAEVNRLLLLAQTPEHQPRVGAATRGSLLVTYRTLRKAKGFPPRLKGNFVGRPRMTGHVGPTPPVERLPPIGQIVRPAPISTDAEVMRLFDEAITKMKDGIAAVQLAQERYGQLVEQQRSTKDIKKLLANLAAQL